MHHWGDGFEHFAEVGEAAYEIGEFCRRWGRLCVTQTKEKYGCYDDKTEVLTDNGWKLFKDADIKTDLFATLDENNTLIYQQATKYHELDTHDKLYTINSRGVDLAVTLDHKLYVAKGSTFGGQNNKHGKSYPYELQTYQELFLKPKKFLKSFNWYGEGNWIFTLPKYLKEWNNVKNSTRVFESSKLVVNMEPWLQFLGWFVAEGCVSKETQITLSLNGTIEDERDYVESILKQLPFQFKTKKRGSAYIINIYSKQLGLWLLEHCGHLSENKKVPKFIHELPPKLIEIFLNDLYLGDGWKTKTSRSLSTTSKTLENDVTVLLMKAGYSVRTIVRDRTNETHKIGSRQFKSNFPEIIIRWLENSNEFELYNSHDSKREKEKIIDYNGKVYCVSVPNQILMVRRNGKPVWCGNTARVYCMFGLDQLHSITHPGYHHSRYPKWLWKLDCYFFSRIIPKFNWLVIPYQRIIYRKAYRRALAKYPFIREEILDAADFSEYLEGL